MYWKKNIQLKTSIWKVPFCTKNQVLAPMYAKLCYFVTKSLKVAPKLAICSMKKVGYKTKFMKIETPCLLNLF